MRWLRDLWDWLMARLRWRIRPTAPVVEVPNEAPTAAVLTSASHPVDAVEGAFAGTITVTDADSSTLTSITSGNSKYTVDYTSGLTGTLRVSAAGVGNFTEDVPESVVLTVIDDHDNEFVEDSQNVTVTAASELELLSTQTIVNEDGSEQAAMPVVMGVAIEAGGVAPGEIVVITDGDDIDYEAQIMEVADTRADGSLVHCVAAFFPGTVAGSGTKTVRVQKMEGVYDNTPGRDFLADIQARDIRIVLTDVCDDNLDAVGSGNLYFSATDASATSERVRVLNTGKYVGDYLIDGHILDDSDDSEIEHLWGEVFASAWANPNGTAYGVELLMAMVSASPWMNVAGSGGFSYKAALYDGVTLIRDFATTKNFSTGNVDTGTNRITITGHGYETGVAVKGSSSGTLPAPLTSSTLAYVRAIDANTITLHTGSATNAHNNVNVIDFTDTGSGTHTLTTYCYQPAWTGYPLNGPDGKSDWLTGTESTLRIQLTQTERDYWIAAGLYPVDNTVTPTAEGTHSYRPGGHLPMRRSVADTGDAEHIGYVSAYESRAFLRQDTVGLRAARVAALHLIGCPLFNVLNEEESGGHKIARVPSFCNGSDGANAQFSGLGSNYPNAYFFSIGNKSGFVTPTGNSGIWVPESGGPHKLHGGYLPFILEGRPHWKHILWRSANHGMASWTAGNAEQVRNFTIGSTTYWGKQIRTIHGNSRGGAWKFRDLMHAAMVGGSCAERDMFSRIVHHENMDFALAVIDWKGAGFDLGIWCIGAGNTPPRMTEPPWQNAFHGAVVAWYLLMRKDDTFLPVAQHLAKLQRALYEGTAIVPLWWASWHSVSAGSDPRLSEFGAEGVHGFATSYDDYGLPITASFATDGTVTFASGTQLTEGDMFRPMAVVFNNPNWEFDYPPELSNQWYYLRDVSGVTGKFYTAASGGSPITYASNWSNKTCAWRPQYAPSSGMIAGHDGYNFSYLYNAIGTMRLLKAAGVEDLDTALSNAESRMSVTFVSNPKCSGYKLSA